MYQYVQKQPHGERAGRDYGELLPECKTDFTEAGEKLGIVDDIFSTGSNDVYVVKDELGKQKLLPGIEDVLKQIDIENGKIIVNLIEGL